MDNQRACLFLFVFCFFSAITDQLSAQAGGAFSLEQIKSYPFPNELVAATTGSRIAWAFNEEGLRNIYVAEGPDFVARRLTNYQIDDGQELSSVSISNDGMWVVYIRGGDFGSNWDDALPVNPTFKSLPPKVQIWAIPFSGGVAKVIEEGENPSISPSGNKVAFTKDGDIWLASLGNDDPVEKIVGIRGLESGLQWSPNGHSLAFQCRRTDHTFIGIYTNSGEPIKWMDPGFYHDQSPRWSADGTQIAFIRQPGSGGAVAPILQDRHHPWSIMVADVASEKAKTIWVAPKTLRGSPPTTHGQMNLNWAGKQITFLSYQDGWPHLYAIGQTGGAAVLLTPGHFMAEYISVSPDGKHLLFSANTGPDPLDIDRRHIVRVSLERQSMEVLTPGAGNEWAPKLTGDGKHLVFIGATAQQSPLPQVMDLPTGVLKTLATDRLPTSFPTLALVLPKQVIFQAPDGTAIHGTLFEPANTDGKNPAVIYVHGGPPRQMLLGWHYSSYYSNAYALNQYLTSQGFSVLAVNYRLGIGYGYDFHRPTNGGTRGASEYQDIKAAGQWLARQDNIDPNRIAIYGGSYGGYLTAMALGRDSDLFAAGVDIHGVHDRTINRTNRYLLSDQYEKASDAAGALEVAWQSSPVSSVDTWTSPVLIIHADDDRNVPFNQSTDLVQRLRQKGVEMETLVIIDDTHHFMLHKNQMRVNKACAEYLMRKLKK